MTFSRSTHSPRAIFSRWVESFRSPSEAPEISQSNKSYTQRIEALESRIAPADVSVSVSPGSVLEDGAQSLLYTFTRTESPETALTVNFSVSGNATFTTDYAISGSETPFTFGPTSGSVTLNPGFSSAGISIFPISDSTVEADETAVLTITSAPGYSIVGAPAAGTIVNDDTDVFLSVAPASANEDGGTNLVYTFTRTGVTTSALTVGFDAAGTATFNTDYTQSGAVFTSTGGSVTFAPGAATATIILDPVADAFVEDDETVHLTIAEGPGYNIPGPATAVGTILNDDTEVSMFIETNSVVEDGASNLDFFFTRSGVTTGALTVNFTIAGTATFNTDYSQSGATTFNGTSGTVTFASESTLAVVLLDATADFIVESDETVSLAVAPGAGYNTSGAAATGTIINDDTDVSVSVAPASVLEDGAPNLVYTFTRNGITTEALSINFNVGGTATFGSDYTQSGAVISGTAGSLTFAAGVSTATVMLDPIADITAEGDETAVFTITSGTGYNVSGPAATGTIVDDDTSVTLAVAPASVTEDGTTNLVYTFTRSGATSSPLTVNFVVGGSAIPSTDYSQTGAATFTGTTGTVIFAAGVTTATVTLAPIADSIVESDETTSLTLATGTGYIVGSAGAVTGTITNDDTSVTLVAPSIAEIQEDTFSSTNLVYTFNRTGVTATALTVNFAVGGTATFGTDYTQAGAATFTGTIGTVAFAAGATTASVTIDPTADTTVEPDETVSLTLTSGPGYLVGSATPAVTTIRNDDTEYTVSVAPASVTEDGSTNLVYTITAAGALPGGTVGFSVGGTATISSDYSLSGDDGFEGSFGIVTFAPGQTTRTIVIDPTTDTVTEADETVVLTLQPGSSTIIGNPGNATGTISNDDSVVTLALSPSSATEDGSTNLVFTFTRTGVVTGALTVNFAVAGSATFTTDYLQAGASAFSGTSGTVTFAAGATTAVVTLDPVADSIVELDETTSLTLAAGSGYSVGSGTAVIGTIVNDDTSVTLVAPSIAEIQEDSLSSTNLVYTFSRTGVTATALTVNFSVGGTAIFATDYTQSGAATFTSTTGTVTFAAGATTASVTIDPTADTTVEPDETVTLTLTSGTGYVVGSPTPAVTTIRSDDTEYTVSVAPASVTEDGSTNLVYTITATGALPSATVGFSVAGTATVGSDYSVSGDDGFEGSFGVVNFAPGQTTRTVVIDPTADTVTEDDETVVLILQSGPSARGTISNDDSVVTLALSPSSATEDGSTNLVYTFTRTGVATGALTVNFAVAGSATFTTDYLQAGASAFNGTSGTVAFAAGATTAVVTLDPVADSIVESDETTSLTLAAGSGYIVGSGTAVIGTIINDDTSVTLVAPSIAEIQEDSLSSTNLVYTFSRTGVTATALTVNFSVGGTATFATDYTQSGAATFTSTTGTVTFAAGATFASVTIDPSADMIVEPDETVSLTLTSGPGYAVGSPAPAVSTIRNDDTEYTVSVVPTAVTEDGSTNLIFTITATGALPGATVAFNVVGTATLDSDYTLTGSTGFEGATGAVTFAPGETSRTIVVDPTADTETEDDETVVLALRSFSSTNIGNPGSATGTISNDDSIVSLALSPSSVIEDGATNLVYTFTRTGAVTGALTVNFAVAGTAAFNTDYSQAGASAFNATTGTVTFAAGASTATVTLDPVTDTLREPDETTTLTLASGSGYTAGTTGAVTGTIINDDTNVTLAVTPASVAEDGTANLVYTFTRDGVTATALTVNFTVDGTATFGTDYAQVGAATFTSTTGTVTFAAGATTATVTVDPAVDSTVENDETVNLTVIGGPGYNAIASSVTSGTIANDDVDVSVSLAASSVNEDGPSNLVYVFNRSGVTTNAMTVNFTVGGTAAFGSDYGQTGAATFNGTAGMVTFAAGSSTASVTLDPTADNTVESDETAVLTVTSGVGYNVGQPTASTGTILNDDSTVTVAVAPAIVIEDGQTNLAYTFTRVGFTGSSLAVSFNVAGTATFGSDYTALGASAFAATTGTIVFGAGQSTATLSIDPTADAASEGNETVALTITPGTGYSTGVPAAAAGTIADDDIDLRVTMVESAPTIIAGSGPGNLMYTVTVSNTGLTDATGVIIADDLSLPVGTTFVSATPSIGSYALTTAPDGTWTLGNLAAGGSATLTVVLTVGSSTAAGANIISSAATITASAESRINPLDDSATESTSVQRLVDLQITKSDSVSTTIPGNALAYAITVSNAQPSDANGVVLTETLPAGTSFNATASTAGWTETTPGSFTLNLNTVAGGSTMAPVTFAVLVDSPVAAGLESIANTVAVRDDGSSGADPTPANNVASDINGLIAAPDLVITKTGTPLSALRGGLITYSLNFSNQGNQNATGVSITETLPANTTYVAAGSTAGWVETAPGSGVFRFDIGSLSTAQLATLTFQVRVANSLSGDGSAIRNSVSIQDDGRSGTDLTPANNSDSLETNLYQGISAFALGRLERATPTVSSEARQCNCSAHSSPEVKVFDLATGELVLDFLAYEATAIAGVRVAVGDFNGDGYDDVVTAYAQGTGRVRVFDGVTGDRIAIGEQTELNPFGLAANSGAFVATGDVTGDGRDDIIVGAGLNGKQVKVYDGVTGQLAAKFKPFDDATTGVRVAVGDLNGDGIADIIAGQRGGGSGVRVFVGGSLPATGAPELLLKTRFGGTDGVFVTAGDIDGDGLAELIMGSGEHSPSTLSVYSTVSRSVLYETSVFSRPETRGVRVATADINFDGIAEIIATPSGKGRGEVLFLNGSNGSPLAGETSRPFPNNSNLGVYVAGSSPVPFVQTIGSAT